MSAGWASIHRRLTESDFWLSEPFTKPQAWVDMIVMANHKKATFWVRGIEVKVKRGQLGWSQVSMAKRWRWSRQKVRRFLEQLVRNEMIEIDNSEITSRQLQKTRQQTRQPITTIITLKNYDKYQPIGTANDTADEHQKSSKRYTNNNDNNDKNDKKEKPAYQEKTSKNSLVPCTAQELWQVAWDLQLPLEVVKFKHAAILDEIEAGEFKYKTVHLTLKKWLRMGIERGQYEELDWMGKSVLKDQNPELMKKREEGMRRLEAQL